MIMRVREYRVERPLESNDTLPVLTEKLESILGVSITEDHIQDIDWWARVHNAYFKANSKINDERPSESARFLQKLQGQVKRLKKTGDELLVNADNKPSLGMALGFFEPKADLFKYPLSWLMRKDNFKSFLEQLEGFSTYLEFCIGQITENSQAETHPEGFMSGLGEIYQEITKRKPGRSWSVYEGKETGPFLRFVTAICDHFDIEILNLQYLIRKYIQNMA